MHSENCFLTLTYEDKHVPRSLDYVSQFQPFIKRLRAHFGRRREKDSGIRFFACGEYGDTWRAHYHCMVFGAAFHDLSPVRHRLFRSPELERLWPFGFSSIGTVEYDSAAYVAGYCLKKATGPLAIKRYERCDWESGEIYSLTPEFAKMSLKPGIGANWFAKYWREVYGPRDGCVLPGGVVVRAPRYYDNLLMDMELGLMAQKKNERLLHLEDFAKECTPDRLRVREACAIARNKLKERYL